jgi:hypothetical protein
VQKLNSKADCHVITSWSGYGSDSFPDNPLKPELIASIPQSDSSHDGAQSKPIAGEGPTSFLKGVTYRDKIFDCVEHTAWLVDADDPRYQGIAVAPSPVFL